MSEDNQNSDEFKKKAEDFLRKVYDLYSRTSGFDLDPEQTYYIVDPLQEMKEDLSSLLITCGTMIDNVRVLKEKCPDDPPKLSEAEVETHLRQGFKESLDRMPEDHREIFMEYFDSFKTAVMVMADVVAEEKGLYDDLFGDLEE